MKITGILTGFITGAMILSACSGKDDPEATASTTTPTGASSNSNSGSTGDTEDTGDSATGTTGTASGTSPTTDPTSTTDPTAGTGTDTDDCSFLMCGDMGGGGGEIECDVWSQDCPEGEKCMPWANDGGSSWNATKCSPIDPAPQQPGDVCTTEGGGVSGVDNCVKSAMCWDVDGETNEGVCIAFCEGTNAEDGTCDAGFSCTIVNDGVLILCLPDCDPLLQDCPGDDLCIPNGENFICVLDASGEAGLYGDPCEYANACKPGLYCLNPEYVEGCQAAGCCTPFCDLKDFTCPGGTQDCIPWYEEGMAPPGKEDVGICGIPQ